jgi:hypothetical protein
MMTTPAEEDHIYIFTLLDVIEPLVSKIVERYKRRPRRGDQLDALRALERIQDSITTFRIKANR